MEKLQLITTEVSFVGLGARATQKDLLKSIESVMDHRTRRETKSNAQFLFIIKFEAFWVQRSFPKNYFLISFPINLSFFFGLLIFNLLRMEFRQPTTKHWTQTHFSAKRTTNKPATIFCKHLTMLAWEKMWENDTEKNVSLTKSITFSRDRATIASF